MMTAGHASCTNIDGGFEFNGWYGYDANYSVQPSKSWWWVQGDDTVISFGQIPGYVESSRYPFVRWMPFGQGNILVLERLGASTRGEAAK